MLFSDHNVVGSLFLADDTAHTMDLVTKFEDEEDLRERTRSLFKDSEGSSELEAACTVLNDLSLRQEVLRPLLIEVLRQLGALLNREITLYEH